MTLVGQKIKCSWDLIYYYSFLNVASFIIFLFQKTILPSDGTSGMAVKL